MKLIDGKQYFSKRFVQGYGILYLLLGMLLGFVLGGIK